MKTIDCIESVVSNMSDEEKDILTVVLKYGRESENKKIQYTNYYKYITPGWVASEIDLNYNSSSDSGYGWILENIIKDVLSKSQYISKPNLSSDYETYKGAIQREEWITENILNSIMEETSQYGESIFSGRLKPLLEKNGISENSAEQAEDAIFQGGLKAALKLQGIDFHMIVEQVSKIVVEDIGESVCEDPVTGDLCEKPIEETQKRWLERIFSSVFISLPLNGHSRCEYDKLIPAIFIIGVSRLANPDNNEKPTAPKNEEQGSGHLSKNFKRWALGLATGL